MSVVHARRILTVTAPAAGLAGLAVQPAAAAATLRHQVQNAHTEFRSGLRHEDGDLRAD